MKILNLYSGIGGNRKLWGDTHDITAVEFNPEIAQIYKDFFPNDKMIIGDAHQYLLEHFHKYEFIWSSPPCPTHSRFNNINFLDGKYKYPDMTL
jgi:DNA (cytosine-5)-methyltransferase 1